MSLSSKILLATFIIECILVSPIAYGILRHYFPTRADKEEARAKAEAAIVFAEKQKAKAKLSTNKKDFYVS